MTEPELSVVMPAYEEGERILPTLAALEHALRGVAHETLVVVDQPVDSTVEPVRAFAETGHPSVRIELTEGRGVLPALRTGIKRASGASVCVTMADGSDDYRVMVRALEMLRGGADVVAPSRYMRGGRQVGGPRLKKLMSRSAGLTLYWFAGVPIHDATNNFKFYSRRFLMATQIESEAGFELALELSVKATLQGRQLAEVPTTWRDRTGGESRFRLRKWLPHYLRWYVLAFRGRFRRRPPPGAA